MRIYFLKINLTFSKLPSLEHNEIYQCIFKDKSLSAHSQAIKLDHNRLSCPTPSHLEHSKSFEHASGFNLSLSLSFSFDCSTIDYQMAIEY